MYNILKIRVVITNKSGVSNTLAWVNNIEYENDIMSIGAKLTIKCPLNTIIPYNNSLGYLVAPLRTVLFEGDAVKVYCQYIGQPSLNIADQEELNIFNGYIYKFLDGQPSTIVCEDEKYNLRKGVLNKTWNTKVTLKEILQYTISNTKLTLFSGNADINFESFWIENVSPLAVLEKIKNDTRLITCIINNVLYCSLVPTSGSGIYNFSTDTNVYHSTIQQQDGTWKQFIVKVNFVEPKGKKNIFFVSNNPSTGNTDTFNISGLANGKGTSKNLNPYKIDRSTAENLAKNAIEGFKLGEYQGEITTMIYPNTKELSIINYLDITYPNRNGSYLILNKKITLSTTSGAKQILKVSQIKQG